MILNAKEILKQLYNCCDLIEERLLDGDEKPGCDLRKQLLKDTASFAARVSARKTITEAEAAFLNALTGRKDTAEVWIQGFLFPVLLLYYIFRLYANNL